MIHEPLKVPRAFPDGLTLAIVAEVLAERMRQVEQFGHTPEADMALPLSALPIAAQFKLDRATKALVRDLAQAQDRTRAAVDHAQFNNHAPARANLIRAAAMILAAVARIDGEARNG